MSGRLEKEEKIEKNIQEKLKSCPQILKDYMLSTTNKQTSVTRMQYLRNLIKFINFMNEIGVDIYKAKPMHIDRYRDSILQCDGHKASASSINTKLSAVISFYKFLYKNELVTSIPCTNDMKVKVPEKESVVFMTDKEVDKLKDNIVSHKHRRYKTLASRDLAIVTLGCSTGMRVSEIADIDLEDIDFRKKEIKIIAKGNKVRIIYIGDNTVDVLKKWLKDRPKFVRDENNHALFLSRNGNRISTDAINTMIAIETGEMGKHITPHKMRSTCAMKLYDKTGDIYLTAQQLGHSNVKNTMIYAKATEDKRRAAADLLD